MRRQKFCQLVADALDALPEQFRRLLANIAVVVEDTPTREILEELGVGPQDTLLGVLPTRVRETRFSMAYSHP